MRKYPLALAALTAALLLGGTVRAEEMGLQLAIRSGAGIPFGDVTYQGAKLNDVASVEVPVVLELGYRLTRTLHPTAFAQYGYVRPADCPTSGMCHGNDLRLGLGADYHLMPSANLDPYLGLGIAYEQVHTERGAQFRTLRGMEWINAQVGLDYRADMNFSIGPYVSYRLGEFLSVQQQDNGPDRDVTGTAHHWLQFGLKGTYDL